jgi:phosphoribosylformimino-5-aminoimidazole carboxamide ribotide isomerase
VKVIPVIDILNGVVVHAVRGRRKEYQPLESVLCASTDPVDVARALKEFGFAEMYVADLDAITGGHTNFSVFQRIADETGFELMVDAGITDVARAKRVLESSVSRVIIGTETLSSIGFVREAVEFFGSEKIVVSLDLMGDKVLSKVEFDGSKDPVALLREFQEMGVAQIIVLDLARVGSVEGVNLPILKRMLMNHNVKVLVGGGVRDVRDLVKLKSLGVSGVLLATALHSGRITLEELRLAGLLPQTEKP